MGEFRLSHASDFPSSPQSTPLRAKDQIFWDYWFLEEGILKIRILSRIQIVAFILLFFPALWLDDLFLESLSAVSPSAIGVVLAAIVLFALPFAPSAALFLAYPYLKRRRILSLSKEDLLRGPNRLIPWGDVSAVEVWPHRRIAILPRGGKALRARVSSDENATKTFIRDRLARQPSSIPVVDASVEPFEPFVCGTDGSYSLYIIDDKGITCLLGTRLEGILIFGALAGAAILLGAEFQISYYTLVALFYIAALPIVEELNLKRAQRLAKLPVHDLMARAAPSDLIPWSRLRMITYAHNTFRVSDPKLVFTALDHESAEKALETIKRIHSTELIPEKPRLGTRISYRLASGPSLFAILFAIETLILFAAAVLPLFPGEQAQYATVIQSTRNQLAGATPPKEFFFIFLNNVQVALGDAIPFLGQIALTVSTYNTGRVIQVLAIQDSVSAYILLKSLYLLPHTWVETLSYSVASGVFIQYILNGVHPKLTPTLMERLQSWRNRPDLRLSISYLKVAGMLAAAGFLEVTEPLLGEGAYALWLPVFGFALWYLWRQVRLKAKNDEEIHIQPITGT